MAANNEYIKLFQLLGEGTIMPHRTSTDFIYQGGIVKLLSIAAALTPEYPAYLLYKRKIKFLEQIMMFSIASWRANQGTNTFVA